MAHGVGLLKGEALPPRGRPRPPGTRVYTPIPPTLGTTTHAPAPPGGMIFLLIAPQKKGTLTFIVIVPWLAGWLMASILAAGWLAAHRSSSWQLIGPHPAASAQSILAAAGCLAAPRRIISRRNVDHLLGLSPFPGLVYLLRRGLVC